MLPWRMAFVPEGQHDRSLARSAWEKRPSKAPSRRVRYDRAQLTHNYFSSKCASFSFRNARYSSWKAFRDHFHSAQRYRIRNFLPSNLQIDAHTRTNHTVPYGTVFGVALSQALRARLRSCCPSGTKKTPRQGLDLS